MKLTLASGRAHPKHTEGGDFRQATYRAVRQGLRTAAARGDCVLLEPWYTFTLRLPQEAVGRALADMPRLFADFDPPVTEGGEAVITGRAPVSELMGYAREVAAYTRGRGQLACLPGGYAECHNAEEVIAAAGALIAAGVDAVFTPTDNKIMDAELAIKSGRCTPEQSLDKLATDLVALFAAARR